MKTYILLDRSGSMTSLWEEALGSINGYVKKLEGKQKLFLAAFDGNAHEGVMYDVIRDCAKSKWTDVKPSEIQPRGMTPLNDAIAETILRMLEDDEAKAVLVVMTDGAENASKQYNRVAVQSLLKRIEMKDWQVVFLGANFDAIKEEAASYGVDFKSRGIITTNSTLGSTFNTLAGKVNLYASASVGEGAATMDWTDQEQEDVSGKK